MTSFEKMILVCVSIYFVQFVVSLSQSMPCQVFFLVIEKVVVSVVLLSYPFLQSLASCLLSYCLPLQSLASCFLSYCLPLQSLDPISLPLFLQLPVPLLVVFFFYS